MDLWVLGILWMSAELTSTDRQWPAPRRSGLSENPEVRVQLWLGSRMNPTRGPEKCFPDWLFAAGRPRRLEPNPSHFSRWLGHLPLVTRRVVCRHRGPHRGR